LIWVDGKIVADQALSVSVLDRTFEHGLGLFETLRTWNRRVPVLVRHLNRLVSSAKELEIAFDLAKLPDANAVEELLAAEQVEHDVVLRITLSGGSNGSAEAMLWMRTAPLPAPMHGHRAVVDYGTWEVLRGDRLARHKTLNYWSRRRVFETAQRLCLDEVLSSTADGQLWEGSRTNLFVVKDSRLLTPSAGGPIVPGIMRALVLEAAKELPITVEETDGIAHELLAHCDEVFLTNSVRGLIPVRRLKAFHRETPGELTKRLQIAVGDRISAHLSWED
jgi:branched-subunit amino acid aminotransferase/4-amino-4-deoxychorismate lyase